ncbi:SCO-spondin [Dirofilaria immitis]
MRVRCLPTTVIIILFLLLAGITYPKRRIHSTVITIGVNAAPIIQSQSMLSSDLDNLRRSIAVLRHAVGNSIAGSVLRLPSSQHHLHRDASSSSSYGRRGESSEAAILNVKADIRRMNEADVDQFDDDFEDDDRLMQADRPSIIHRTRHFRQRKRRKGCGASRHGHQQMLCPTRSSHHYDVCITSEQLCDDITDCPGGEDENPSNCLFYKSIKDQLKHIYNTVLLLADHATGQNNNHREL